MKKNALRIFVVICGLFFATFSFAEDEVALFKDFKYGSSQEEVKKIMELDSCGVTREGYDVLCRKDYVFFQEKWKIFFCFEKKRLVMVVLSRPASEKAYTTTMKSLPPDFVLVAINGDNGVLDIVSVVKGGNESQYFDTVNKFEQEALKGSCVLYTFFDAKNFKLLINEAQNVTDLARNAPDSLREIDVELKANKLTMRFLAPIRALKDSLDNSPAVKEKF